MDRALAQFKPLHLPLSSSFSSNTVSRNLWQVKMTGQEFSRCSLVVNNDVSPSNTRGFHAVTARLSVSPFAQLLSYYFLKSLPTSPLLHAAKIANSVDETLRSLWCLTPLNYAGEIMPICSIIIALSTIYRAVLSIVNLGNSCYICVTNLSLPHTRNFCVSLLFQFSPFSLIYLIRLCLYFWIFYFSIPPSLYLLISLYLHILYLFVSSIGKNPRYLEPIIPRIKRSNHPTPIEIDLKRPTCILVNHEKCVENKMPRYRTEIGK